MGWRGGGWRGGGGGRLPANACRSDASRKQGEINRRPVRILKAQDAIAFFRFYLSFLSFTPQSGSVIS